MCKELLGLKNVSNCKKRGIRVEAGYKNFQDTFQVHKKKVLQENTTDKLKYRIIMIIKKIYQLSKKQKQKVKKMREQSSILQELFITCRKLYKQGNIHIY
eukprot:TRINITY_DN7424_c0_g1_i9.p4 TRINITY_DN7424_c0_g1~~TRINITY_DN7424_c0_g1_i9.p4  ORF type:complete len:100 (-),score=2.98 TRINITY_DN7424_c0_g1_i9:763-1062(-)